MKFESTRIPGVFLIEPRVFEDPRGYFMEVFQKTHFQNAGVECEYVQDNQSRSCRATVRGLHYQIEHPQGKLLRVIRGEVFDVAVDLRSHSPTYCQWFGAYLSETNCRQLYIPPGLAHGFCATSEVAELLYKCTDYYYPQHERTILWNDPELAIDWPVTQPLLSEKDRRGLPLHTAPVFEDIPVEG